MQRTGGVEPEESSPHWFLRYGLAHFGKSLFWSASELLFAYFLTEVAYIPPRQMGVVLAVGLFFGAVADLGVGRAIQSRLSHAAGAAGAQLFGAWLNGGTLFLMFLGPFLPENMRFMYLMATGLLFRIAFSIYDIPQNALMSLATATPAVRTRLASIRMFFSGVSSLLLASALFPVLANISRDAKAWYFLGLGMLMSAVAILTALGLQRRLRGLTYASEPVAAPGRIGLAPAVWAFIVCMSTITGIASVFGKVEPYYATYVIKSAAWGSAIAASLYVGLTISQPAWNFLAQRTSRRRVLILCALLMLGFAALYAMCGRWPNIAFVVAFGFGVSNGGIAGMMWAIFADKAAHLAKGREGIAYSMLGAGMKTGIGVAILVLGEILTAWDFRVADPAILIVIATSAMFLLSATVLGLIWGKAL